MHPVERAENIIQVDHLCFSYGKGEPALWDVSFAIHRGDYLGIIGPNGAGKTTLLKSILGLLAPTSGTITLFGQEIGSFKDWYKISYVPQKATHFDVHFPATVEEIVRMGRYARRGLFHSLTSEDRALAQKALEQVEMQEFRHRLIGDLSGGQQQRVFLARTLAAQPEIIFLDEPTVGIDEKVQGEFYNLLRRFNRDLNLTLVLISHNLEVVAEEAMHIACINRKLEYFGSVGDFFKGGHAHKIQGTTLLSHHTH